MFIFCIYINDTSHEGSFFMNIRYGTFLSFLCVLYSLFFFFKTKNFFLLATCFVFLFYLFFCCQVPRALLWLNKKTYSSNDCDFLHSAEKKSDFFCGFFTLLYAVIFILNIFIRRVPMLSLSLVLFAASFAAFPQNLFFNAVLCINKYIKKMSKLKVKISSLSAADDIIRSKTVVIDDFESFLNISAVKNISKLKNIVLLTKKSEFETKKICSDFLNLVSFSDVSKNQPPVFSKEKPIAVYPSASLNDILPLIQKQNSTFLTVCQNKISSPFRISENISDNTDITFPQKDMLTLQSVFNCQTAMQKSFQNCFIYTLSLSFASFFFFTAILFLTGSFALSCVMFSLLPCICILLPNAALACDTNKTSTFLYSKSDIFCHIILDSMLISVCCVLVFLIARFTFSPLCTQLICFNTFIISSLLYAFNIRSEKSVFLMGLLKNKTINFSFFFGICMAVAASYFASSKILKNGETIGAGGWILIFAMSLIPFALTQIQKACTDIFKV